LLCKACQPVPVVRLAISRDARRWLRDLSGPGEAWRGAASQAVRGELRRLLGHHVTWLLGRRPRLLPYLTGLS
jgi:hypothetical protein